VTDNYRAAFEAARRQVASAERTGEEWGRVVEAIHALARSAQRVDAAEREKVLAQLDRAVGAAESRDASRVMHDLRLAEREIP
jgi:HPt (histidine-containing phosphotransfer) domain-containing protein